MNTGVHVSFQTMFFSRYMPRNGIAGSCDFVAKYHVYTSMTLTIPVLQDDWRSSMGREMEWKSRTGWEETQGNKGKVHFVTFKRCLLFERKVTTNLDSILKSRDITLPTKVRLIKAMVFPVVMYGCESWTMKKAECRRIDAFELWCWRRLLRVPWNAKRSNQSILKETSPGC